MLVLALLTPDVHAQTVCDVSTSRPAREQNVFVDFPLDWIGDASDSYDEVSLAAVPLPLTTPTVSLNARVGYDINVAQAEIWGIGGGEVGVELTINAFNAAGALLCTRTEHQAIARFNESPSAPLGRDSLSCTLPFTQSAPVTIELVGHIWASYAGLFAAADAGLDVDIVDYAVEACTGSCNASSCGSVTASNGRRCYCDDDCAYLGDCCANADTTCNRDSCWSHCGAFSWSGNCACDSACSYYDDCCDDEIICSL